MNKDDHLIFEGYKQKRHITPKESFQRDKEFFEFVIENNDHLSPLKNLSTKKLFYLYTSTLADRINQPVPGIIKESNITDSQAFSILNEATQTVTDQEAYDSVKDIFEQIIQYTKPKTKSGNNTHTISRSKQNLPKKPGILAKAGQFLSTTGKDTAKGIGKGLKTAGELLNPWGKKGLLANATKLSAALRNYLGPGQHQDHRGSGSQETEFSKFRQTNIYPRDNDDQLNSNLLSILQLQHFPIDKDGFHNIGKGLTNRTDTIKSAAHLANIVLDIAIGYINKQVPQSQALENAKGQFHPQVIRFLVQNKLLP